MICSEAAVDHLWRKAPRRNQRDDESVRSPRRSVRSPSFHGGVGLRTSGTSSSLHTTRDLSSAGGGA
eukprot:scaffold16735_cov33-Tisochrysis_lutea.AAC.7